MVWCWDAFVDFVFEPYKYCPVAFLLPARQSTVQLTESLLMRDDTRFWRLIRNSLPVRTLIFMCMGTTIMDIPRLIKRTGCFWFIQPAARRDMPANEPSLPSPILDQIIPIERRVCLHSNTSCDQFIGTGISTYVKIGVGIETVRLLFSQFNAIRRSPLAVLQVFRQHMNWRLIAFLGTYAAMYRVRLYCVAFVVIMLNIQYFPFP